MSFRTEKLTRLFPDAYAVRDHESVLFKLLDAVGAELNQADATVRELLKSHWVRWASGPALDALGSLFGVTRRVMREGQPEPDTAFRQRLQAVVPFFTGGGTVRAVEGAVRSALGLPFDLDDLGLPEQFAALRADLQNLVQMREFSPVAERMTGNSTPADAEFSQVAFAFDLPSVGEDFPHIECTFPSGGGRHLRLERLGEGAGIVSTPMFFVPAGQTLVLTASREGWLNASIDTTDVSAQFTNLDGSMPARLPAVPEIRSEWQFRARSGVFDLSSFDADDTFGSPEFRVESSRIRRQRLTFDVQVPFFLQETVADMKRQHGYSGELLVFEGLPPDRIQDVINQTAAAGVHGKIRFALHFFEPHPATESFRGQLQQQLAEDNSEFDSLVVAGVNRNVEVQQIKELFALGGLFEVAVFDGDFGFQ